jgi:LytS/YehU family sensor histidine kinase
MMMFYILDSNLCYLILFVLVSFVAGYAAGSKSRRHYALLKKELRQKDMQAARFKMNTHFVYNCLNAISNLIAQEKTLDAMKGVSDFAFLNRFYLDAYSKPLISLELEIQFLRAYVALQNLRFKNSVVFKVVLRHGLQASVTYLPPMLLQPLVENSIMHGFVNSLEKIPSREIVLKAEKVGERLVLTCKDNGCGFDVTNTPATSHGLSLIRELLDLAGMNGALEIASVPGAGTTAIMSFNYTTFNIKNSL